MGDTRTIIQKIKGINNGNIGKDGRVIATQGMPLNYRDFYWEPDFRPSAPENAVYNPGARMIKGVPVDGYDSYYWRTLHAPISENVIWNDEKVYPNGYTYSRESDATRDNALQSKYNKMMDAQGGSSMNNNFNGYREAPKNSGTGEYGAKQYNPASDLIDNVLLNRSKGGGYENYGETNRLNKNNSQSVSRVAEPMNAEANAQAQRGATKAELQRLAKTNPSLFRQIAKVMAENPLEGGKLFGMAAVPFAMAGAGQDPMTNYIGGTGMLAGSMANTAMDASMVAKPFVDAYGYVQSPEYIEERRRQMEEGLD